MEYLFHILILFSVFGTLALAQNLVMGEAGMLSASSAAFYGVGAYVVGILTTKLGLSFFTVLLIAPAIGCLVAFLIGTTFVRFRGDYFMLSSLGFLMIFNTVARNWEALTGGSYGISGISKPNVFGLTLGTPFSFLFLAVPVLAFAAIISYLISRSSFGRVLNAIREDEDALKIFGYKTSWYKLIIFSIGAALMSIAGAVFASYLTFIDAGLFTVRESILIWAMIILGGIGRTRGALFGAFLLVLLPEVLRFVGFPSDIAALLREFSYGLILVLLMLFRPKGVWGKYEM